MAPDTAIMALPPATPAAPAGPARGRLTVTKIMLGLALLAIVLLSLLDLFCVIDLANLC